jgi:UDP-N-acetylmuramate dehydrogenase
MFGNLAKMYCKTCNPKTGTDRFVMLDAAAKTWLEKTFGDRALFDEPMGRHTSFRIGGPADALIRPTNEQEIARLIVWARAAGIPWTVVGRGTNLLVSDKGIRGIVIAVTRQMGRLVRSDKTVYALAGAGMPALCRFAAEQGLAGLNFAVGIPGTVGGALAMNAGTKDGAMADVLVKLSVILSDGTMKTMPRNDVVFSYRRLAWPEDVSAVGDPLLPVISGAQFELTPANPEDLTAEIDRLLDKRRRTQPLELPNAGCMFKNPLGDMTAGELIDRANLKNTRIGGAQVSEQHANFVVNTGGATADDVLALMAIIRKTVEDRFKVALEPEVTVVGQETD